MAENIKYIKKYKCPYCEVRCERDKLDLHIEKMHKEMIPQGYTAARVAFNYLNKKECGHCIICGNETEWNEDKKRYERLCGSKSCLNKYKKLCEERLKNKTGKTKEEMLSDPEFQNKMLNGRKISGKYVFEDKGSLGYVGTYEKNFLEFMDKFLHVKSEDIISPGPTVEYYYEGKKHFWITDFYYIPYNLVLDIKDGGSNPNNRNMPEYRAKQSAKEKAITSLQVYNYIRLTDNQFDQLIEIMFELRDSLNDLEGVYKRDITKVKPIIKINEVFDQKSIEMKLQDVMTDPHTYKTKRLTELEAMIKDVTDPYTLLNIETWLATAVAEGAERWVQYHMFLNGGKCTYDYQEQCETLSLNNITLEDMTVVNNNVKTLFNIIKERYENSKSKLGYQGATNVQLNTLSPITTNGFTISESMELTQDDLEYFAKYLI